MENCLHNKWKSMQTSEDMLKSLTKQIFNPVKKIMKTIYKSVKNQKEIMKKRWNT